MPSEQTLTRSSPGQLDARQVDYLPTAATNWSGNGPVDVAEALDEIMATGFEHRILFLLNEVGVSFDATGFL